MFVAKLAALVLLAQQSASAVDPAVLVARLGASRYAERQAAAVELERLGARALPALLSARAVKDPEIRSRASALIARIEGALLTQPTLVTLDFDNRPLAEIVKTLGDRCGIKLLVYPDLAPGNSDHHVTLREPGPVPFWKAMDRLCDAGHLQYNLGGMHGNPLSRETVFPLFRGGARPTTPTMDTGPFRVSLVSLHYQRDVTFTQVGPQPIPNRAGLRRLAEPPVRPGGPGHTLTEQFFVQIQVAAEPRLSVSQHGPLKFVEAVDDRGQSLLPDAQDQGIVQRFSGYFGLTAGSSLHLQAPLLRPENPGRTVKSLRGVLPVLVATRKPGPLVIPLNGAAGKSFRNDEVSIAVDDVKTNAMTRQTSIELTVRHTANPERQDIAAPPNGMDFGAHRPDTHQQQIDVLDAQGRAIPWYHSNDGEGARMILTLAAHDAGAPAEIRYYAMARATSDVRFIFHNVPLP
jgi:hypothetical protein